MYNNIFNQCLEVIIDAKDHSSCLLTAAAIKKQCDAWLFCVRYNEYKSARKGPVLKRDFLIYINALPNDIAIFKQAINRICEHYNALNINVQLSDRGLAVQEHPEPK